jgi:hypothetical protein
LKHTLKLTFTVRWERGFFPGDSARMPNALAVACASASSPPSRESARSEAVYASSFRRSASAFVI